ncbi:hypothetical protein [Radiobacillus sp. PE A8.2]
MADHVKNENKYGVLDEETIFVIFQLFKALGEPTRNNPLLCTR